MVLKSRLVWKKRNINTFYFSSIGFSVGTQRWRRTGWDVVVFRLRYDRWYVPLQQKNQCRHKKKLGSFFCLLQFWKMNCDTDTLTLLARERGFDVYIPTARCDSADRPTAQKKTATENSYAFVCTAERTTIAMMECFHRWLDAIYAKRLPFVCTLDATSLTGGVSLKLLWRQAKYMKQHEHLTREFMQRMEIHVGRFAGALLDALFALREPVCPVAVFRS